MSNFAKPSRKSTSKTKYNAGDLSHKDSTNKSRVEIVNSEKPRPNLCDVIADELLLGRDPDHPVLCRVAVIGQKYKASSKGDAAPDESVFDISTTLRSVIESNISTVAKNLNSWETNKSVKQNTISDENKQSSVITGTCVEFAAFFICVFEGEPAHIDALMKQIKKEVDLTSTSCAATPPQVEPMRRKSSFIPANAAQNISRIGSVYRQPSLGSSFFFGSMIRRRSSQILSSIAIQRKDPMIKAAYVIYLVDDIMRRSSLNWVHIDASKNVELAEKAAQEQVKTDSADNTTGTENTTTRLTDKQKMQQAIVAAKGLDSAIIDVVYNLLNLGKQCDGMNKVELESFCNLEAQKNCNNFIPPVSFIERCYKSQLCLSIEEYTTIFTSGDPEVFRADEAIYPAEPSYKYV